MRLVRYFTGFKVRVRALSGRRAGYLANCTRYSLGTESVQDITGVCYPGVKVQLNLTIS